MPTASSDYHFVLISGSREWGQEPNFADDFAAMAHVIFGLWHEYHDRLVIVEGGQRGADHMAKAQARVHGIMVAEVEANWAFYDKAAGPIRNGWMLRLPIAEAHCFHHDIGRSKGTKQMIKLLGNRKIPFTLHE